MVRVASWQNQVAVGGHLDHIPERSLPDDYEHGLCHTHPLRMLESRRNSDTPNRAAIKSL